MLPSLDELRDLELLVRARHSLVLVETVEDDRIGTLFAYLADRLGLPLYVWSAHRGLVPPGNAPPVAGSERPEVCLDYIENARFDALYHLVGFTSALHEPAVASRLAELHKKLLDERGAIFVTGPDADLPRAIEPLFTKFDLAPPSEEAYYQFVSSVLRDLRSRIDVKVELSGEDVAVLLGHLRGLSFFEVRKIIAQAVIEDGRLDRDDIARVLEAKKRAIQRSGVLDYYPAEETLADVAGLSHLKSWLQKRAGAFASPEEARRFGLSPPRGLLLLGVQGCGKSLCAKAVASEWQLPLIRLDPSSLYNKYVGESEKNLKRAVKTAEQMAPIVLWIDEIEKAFGSGGGDGADAGTSSRIFGTFLTWLNDKKESVFVIATANDISRLPPELLRKGRFDEIFFVDLPDGAVRRDIFTVHLRRRQRAPEGFDLDALAAATDGFSGAEIEQIVLSALYTAFADRVELSTELLLAEVAATRPLSVTMSEKIDELRAWAKERAVLAG